MRALHLCASTTADPRAKIGTGQMRLSHRHPHPHVANDVVRSKAMVMYN